MYCYYVDGIKFGPASWEELCLMWKSKAINDETQIILPDGSKRSFLVLREKLKNYHVSVPRDTAKNDSISNEPKETGYIPSEVFIIVIAHIFRVIFGIMSIGCFIGACNVECGFIDDSLVISILVFLGIVSLFVAIAIPFMRWSVFLVQQTASYKQLTENRISSLGWAIPSQVAPQQSLRPLHPKH